MNIFQSVILGIIQGLTEFIPVSSTAHLLIAQYLMKVNADDATFAFNVLVQLGTLLALILFFVKDIWKIIKAFFAKPFSTPLNRLGWFIIFATIPALVFGYLLKSAVEELFKSPLLEAGIRLLITTILLLLAEGIGKRNRSLENMDWLDSLAIGLAQVIAVFPGASRSGTTISAGMLRGLDRKSSARFAFLMSIPVMLAAGVYESLDLLKIPNLSSFLPVLAAGFVTAAIVGWLAIKWLLGYLNKHSLTIFAIYCGTVGLIVLTLNYVL
jgi:undecaprenyl-diphosphatase